MMTAWLVYLSVGVIGGILAGLLGVGGGLVIVPALNFAFEGLLQPEQFSYIQHMALGTSLASICFTSISSLRAHHKRGAVNWTIVRNIALGVVLGTFFGAGLAAKLSATFLKGFFVVFLYYVGTQMLLDIKPKAHAALPGMAGMTGVGLVIGVVSALVGIGGGTLSVPFMLFCGMAMHNAVGTSAAIGFPIAVGGTLGFMAFGPASGAGVNIPEPSWGYVYLPALAGVAAMSILTAPLGAKIAHALPVARLKKIFAIFLYLIATRMLIKLL